MMNHWFWVSSNITKPHHSGHFPPWDSPPGHHNGATPEVGQETAAKLKAASSGEMRLWSSVPPKGSSRSARLWKSLVSTTTPSLTNKSRT